MTQPVKTIWYGFPTSPHAAKYGRSEEGCYGIKVWDATDVMCDAAGVDHAPYDTIQEAEAFAESLSAEWWDSYKRWPLPGSKFSKA